MEFQKERTKTTRVQTILFDKTVFKTKDQCVDWIIRQNKERKGRDYDFVHSKYDPASKTEQYHRFRQFDPDDTKEHRTSDWIDKGIKFVFEY